MALVLEVPDWSTLDATSLWRWLSEVVTDWDAVTPLEAQA